MTGEAVLAFSLSADAPMVLPTGARVSLGHMTMVRAAYLLVRQPSNMERWRSLQIVRLVAVASWPRERGSASREHLGLGIVTRSNAR